jgi:MFS family permease
MMSGFHAMWSLGAGAGAASGYLAVGAGASVPLHFFVAGGLITLACAWAARIAWPSDRHETHKAPFIAIPRGALFLVGVVAMCSAIGEGGMADWSALFLVRVAHASEAQGALGYAAYSAVMVAMRLAGNRLTKRFGPVVVGRAAGLAAATGALVAVIFATFPAALAGFALMGVGYALIIPLAFSRAANDPLMTPGRAIAAVSSLGYGGILMGPPLLGFVAQMSSVRFAYLVLAALALIITALAASLRREAVPAAATKAA